MSRPPQALFVSYTSLLGGAERILLDHATALAGPVALACPEGPLADAAHAAGLQVLTLRRRPIELRASIRDRVATPLRLAAQGRELRRIVAQLEPRCVIAWGMRALLSSALGLRDLERPPPLVFQHNDLLPSPLVGRVVRAAARRATLVIALSRAIADDLHRDGALTAPGEIVRAGVDLDRFAPAGEPPTDRPTVLILGAIVAWKRPDLALEIVARAAKEIPAIRVALAGAPIGAAGEALLATLHRRGAEPDLAGRVDFLGAVDDVPATLDRATCLLHCADSEPYGMAMVEALACGRAVVAPSAGGPIEIVDASSGALYPPGDVQAAAAALVEAVARAAELGGGARRRAEAEFDRSVAQARFRTLIDELVPSP